MRRLKPPSSPLPERSTPTGDLNTNPRLITVVISSRSLWSKPLRESTSSTSSTSTTPRCSTTETGPSTESQDLTTTTAPSPSPTTGRVPNSALSHGSAEELDSVREEDGAPASTDARDPLFPLRPLESHPLTEERVRLIKKSIKLLFK